MLTVKNGILYFKESDVEKNFVCDFETNKKNGIIKKYHEEDHAGIKTTFSRVKAHTYGINYIDVVVFLKNCENCLKERPQVQNTGITLIIPNLLRKILLVDTIVVKIYSEHNDGYKYIFTFIDSFTKFAWAYISKTKMLLHFQIYC
ncbi:hypothetical protein DMUE_5926 [Dictyocoela muelleri]|nr:hypothetical protein DMUE_5926 [Dictyocoela muelleri]